jgi:hypothetical protein
MIPSVMLLTTSFIGYSIGIDIGFSAAASKHHCSLNSE